MEEKKIWGYTVDLSGVNNRELLHWRIAAALPCPSYYGNNLDALRDVLTESGQGWRVRFTGCAEMDALMPRVMEALRAVCHDAQGETPGLEIAFFP